MAEQGYRTIDQSQLVKRISMSGPENKKEESGYVLVNVLQPEAYVEAHIPGSINIPRGQENKFAERFSKDKEIIVYCASRDCDASPKVAEKLTDMGFRNVYDYEAGLRDWRQSGHPVETGAGGNA